MPNNSDNILRFDRPGVFSPAFTYESLNKGASTKKYRLDDIDESNIQSTSSFRYDPPGVGLKSTQQLRVDWSKFENHVFFNSAEVAVNVAFDNIINRYPFDGTRRDVEAFLDGLTGFERWVFDSFPKSVGYIDFVGSTNTGGTVIEVVDHAGSAFPTLSKNKTGRSVLDPGTKSFSIEFHVRVPKQANENQILVQKISGSTDGFTVGFIGTGSADLVDILFVVCSGSTSLATSGTIRKGMFEHIVASYDRTQGENRLHLYANTKHIASSSTSIEMGNIGFGLSSMYIGSGSTTSTPTGSFVPAETLSGSLDELRIFHSLRSVELQRKTAKRNIYPTDDGALRLYYKFNEPSGSLVMSQTDAINRIVLDSSGQGLNAFIDSSGFSSMTRRSNTDDNPMTWERLIDNPVLFPAHDSVVELNSTLLTSASTYDQNNPNIITRFVPKHYFLAGQLFDSLDTVDGDIGDAYGGSGIPGQGELGTAQLLSSLLYTIAKHFDEVKLFIDAFGRSIFVDYNENDVTPDQLLPFVAAYYGFELPGMFSNANIDQFISAYDLRREHSYDEYSLQRVQNELWRRILTNLTEIVKSKGTLHSIKAFIRTLGIDPDQNLRIREFGGSKRRGLSESREQRSRIVPFLDVNDVSQFTLVSNPLTGSRIEPGWPYITNTDNDRLYTSGSWTVEGTYKFKLGQVHATSQSLCRMFVDGSALTTSGTLFNLVAVSSSHDVSSSSLTLYGKPATGSTAQDLRLVLSGVDVFDGDQWFITFGRHRNDDVYTVDTYGQTVSSSYFLRAYRRSIDDIRDSYVTSALFLEDSTGKHTSDAQQTLSTTYNSVGPMLICGAQTLGSNIEYLTSSDATVTTFDGMIGTIRFWSRGTTLTESRERARNYRSVGVLDPLRNFNFVTTVTGSFEKLRMDISMEQEVTSSDIFGRINFIDMSQNDLDMLGSGFPATSSLMSPEVVIHSIISPRYDEATTLNKIRIRGFIDDDNVMKYGGDFAPVFETPIFEEPEDDPRFSIDISVVDALNDDIVNIFATFDTLENIIGDPELLFSSDYPKLSELRRIYFNRLTDKINFKSFFEFFKWFDMSIGMFIRQLIPRKTRYLGTNFVIESHMLERPKYDYKYEDVYIGENNRHGLKGDMTLQLINGRTKRY